MILIGGGEHARVVAEAVELAGLGPLTGYVDPQRSTYLDRLGITHLGGDEVVAGTESHAILAMGATGVPENRLDAAQRLEGRVVRWVTVVHPASSVSRDAQLGPGTVVLAGAVVEPGASIGAHCIVGTGAVLCHDAKIADHAIVGPGAVLGGGVHIGFAAFVGMRSTVRDHRSVGERATVAMGSLVVGDVAAGATAMGTPARHLDD